MRNCLFLFVAVSFSTLPVSAQDWYFHPFAGLMRRLGAGEQGVQVFYSTTPLFTVPETTDRVFGVRGGRKLTGRFELEGGFRFSAADRPAFALFVDEDGSIPEPFPSFLYRLKGGNLLVSEIGFKWNSRLKRFAPFLYAGTGTVTRTTNWNEQTGLLLQVLAAQQDRRLVVAASPSRPSSYHVDVGGGAELSMGRRWGIRFELRDRIEPNTFPGKVRHFVEITAGPSFRF